jgi:hypothetical protein
MPFVQLNWKPNKKELRQFGAIFMGGFLLIGLVKYFWPFGWGIARDEWWGSLLVLVGLVVGGIGLTGSRLALPLYWAWLGVAYVLGNVMSRVIMALIYFGIFTPMRFLGSLIGRDRLQLKKPKTDSYWHDIKLPERIEDYEKQF